MKIDTYWPDCILWMTFTAAAANKYWAGDTWVTFWVNLFSCCLFSFLLFYCILDERWNSWLTWGRGLIYIELFFLVHYFVMYSKVPRLRSHCRTLPAAWTFPLIFEDTARYLFLSKWSQIVPTMLCVGFFLPRRSRWMVNL